MNADRSSPTIFLLSPANLSGLRARQLTSSRAQFEVARLYRTAEGVPIAEAFAFMSALYFRGKIAYARQFASSPDGIHIITPGFGLVGPDWRIDAARMRKLRRTDLDLRSHSYRRPLERDAETLASRLDGLGKVVLLGSVATGKYVDILWPIFGSALCFPRCFAGIGNMSRGALMLRAAASGIELEYATMDEPRHRPR